MAEFRISRIRYTWRNSWSTTTVYNRDDVIQYGGSSYVCMRQHTASAFLADQEFLANVTDTDFTPAWRKMTDGRAFRGVWQTALTYTTGDIVINGGNLWLCVDAYTSAVNFDAGIANWTLYAAGDNFIGNWAASTRYGQGAVIKYNGIVYRCIQGHTSATLSNGLEQDQSKWQIYYQGVEFRGVWATGTRYRVNDLVKFGGTIFRCKQGHTPGVDSTLNFNIEQHWELEFPGFQYSNEWNSTTVYQIGDLVRHGGWLYYSLTNNYGSNPVASIYQPGDGATPADWQIAVKGVNFRGTWGSTELYKTGDVVRRGGNLYVALLDTALSADGSSLDYLDNTNWQLLTASQNWRSSWSSGNTYAVGDLIIYDGSAYVCNIEHNSENQNSPGDNGSGYFYWDLVLQAGSEIGLRNQGDLLTYGLSRTALGDGSTLGPARVSVGTARQLVSVNDENLVIYRNLNDVDRVFYVEIHGEDNLTIPQRGRSPLYPWRTVRYACEQADDGYNGDTTIRVGVGQYEEILPITVPAKTVILCEELRSTTISAGSPNLTLSQDSTYMIAALSRISQIMQAVILGTTISPPKSAGNIENVVVSALATNSQAATAIQLKIVEIQAYINFKINAIGAAPSVVGTNTGITTAAYVNANTVLELNRNFLIAEAVAFIQVTYPSYQLNTEFYRLFIDKCITAWKYDIIYTGNYKSLLIARYYRNAVLGSQSDDMFYCRNGTGVRNCTLTGLQGTLNPPVIGDVFGSVTSGAYISLDPGWGPQDTRTWITTRSPYIQGVTTIGTAAIGQKIDGALHDGGNRSIVSNDFTQVISDGIGAWVTNNGRAELVSVFSYYAHIGYLATAGGTIRSLNGNCSYGDFGTVADGVDATETPQTAVSYTRAQQAIVASAFSGDFVDEIQILEWTNAGENYTQAAAAFVGAGVNAQVIFEEFRDDAVFEARLLDTSVTVATQIGGSGYANIQNNAQTGDLTTITIASNDPNDITKYLGMRIVLTSGIGTGQYGYITSYDTVTKIVEVYRESNDQPGWDHVLPGKSIETLLDTGTTYRIEPRVIFSAPDYFANEIVVSNIATWTDIVYGETTETYNGVSAGSGIGTVDGVVPVNATFNVIKTGRTYTVTLASGGAGYQAGQLLTIAGNDLGGETPANNLTIRVTAISNDSTNSIIAAEQETYGTGEDHFAASGRFVAISSGGATAVYSKNGVNWTQFNMPSSGNWQAIAAGNNRFVAIRNGSASAASSLDGVTWTSRTMPASREWNSVVYGSGIFVAVAGNLDAGAISTNGTTWTDTTLPDIGDSSFNEWVDIAYGKNIFVALSNSGNFVATGTYDVGTGAITWTGRTMDVIADSSARSWQSIAYGNNRFVAISNTGDVGYSFDSINWLPASMPKQDGSSIHNWQKIRYAQGVFFAVGDTGQRLVNADSTPGPTAFAATSFDGVVWTERLLASEAEWTSVAFGNPYTSQGDSTVGKNTPTWVAVASGPDGSNKFNKIQTGARALGRANVTGGIIASIVLWDPGSGYTQNALCTLIDPNNATDVGVDCRKGDGVLTNPSWINRGLGYRSTSTRTTITGNGYADVTPNGKFIVINALSNYPGPGSQITIQGLPSIYTIVTLSPVDPTDLGLAAVIRITPEIRVRDNLQHLTPITIRTRFSQVRVTGHDFLDIGTGNFEETNYPALYSASYNSAIENEVVEENGGRVFYTSTDQSGNFRAGELFAVEQATGIVTLSADFFDFSGLQELQLGGIRVGGTGTVVREFSTDPLFTADSNNIIPTQRAIRAYLAGRLTVGGSEIAVGSFIAGTVKVGPDLIDNVASLTNIFAVRTDFEGPLAGISGSMLAQTMFYKSFS